MTNFMRTLILSVLALLFLQSCIAQSPETSDEIAPYEISGSSQNGGFNTFIDQLDETLGEIKIDSLVSGGGADNLRLLENRDVEFALSQRDLAYLSYHGENGIEKNTGFRAVLPLTRAYQQVFVRADSGIETISDLRGKVVAMGEVGSGSFINGRDVLEEMNIEYMLELEIDPEDLPDGRQVSADGQTITIDGLDYVFAVLGSSIDREDAVKIRELGIRPGLDAVHAGLIDAVLVTGSARTRAGLKHIPVPEGVLEALSEEAPYYSVSPSPAALVQSETDPFAADMLSVTIYLLANPDVPADRVRTITNAVLDNWTSLSTRVPDLVDSTLR